MQLRAPTLTAALLRAAPTCVLLFLVLGSDARAQGLDPTLEPGTLSPASPPADVVVRRDGTSVSGVILGERTGDWIIVLGAHGAVTIPWGEIDRVIRSAAPAPAPSRDPGADSTKPESHAATTPDAGSDFRAEASKRITGVSLGLDLWGDANALFKHYTLGDGSSYWSYGGGVGAVAAVALRFRGPPLVDESHRADWLECELGFGVGGHGGFWKPQTVASAAMVEGEIPFVVGVRYAVGHLRPAPTGLTWSGALLGLAWAPTYVYFFGQPGVPAGGAFNPAGIRLTVDLGRMGLEARGLVPELRFVVGWLPNVGPLPSVISAGVGCAFY